MPLRLMLPTTSAVRVVRNELDMIDIPELGKVGFDLGGGGLKINVGEEEFVGAV